MTKRPLSLVAALALVLAACGGTTETTTTAGADSTTTSPPPSAEAVLLSYSLAAGDEFQYEVGIDQHIDLEASGDASAMGGEEMPGEASVDISGTADFTHTVADGPEEGTYEIHITGNFQDVSVTGTIDGEPVDSSEVPDFASLEPVDVTVVVDEQGNVISAGGEDIEDPLGGMFGDLGSMGGSAPAPGLDPGQFFGPLFSDDEVAVGDIWSDEIETPGFGEEPIVTSVTNTITGVEQFDGADVFVIETTSTTSPVEFDLAEFFRGLFGAFIPEEATAEETAEFEELMGQLRFLINIDDTTANGTSRFDAEAGVARQSEVTAATHIAMDMMIPDETTGEMIGFQMEMTIDQDITYHLISGPSV
ncbi:MAG TPA: hypothetical protein VI689_00620 [Acidimicrobiia bacterium]|nr:hypothetical protein [Acidimicrobiia bacterium]